jgi:AraC-like DNA-binding protein
VQQFSSDWSYVPHANIEDLSNAVFGAGLEATQLTSTDVSGSLVYIHGDGIVLSSGVLNGRVAFKGTLSEDQVTLGLGLRIAPGSRHWISQEIETGCVGIFMPGDGHDALYYERTFYITATLDIDRLEQVAARMGNVLDKKTLHGTGFDAKLLDRSTLQRICSLIAPLHQGAPVDRLIISSAQQELMSAFVNHLARDPRPPLAIPDARGHAAIVSRAREFIERNLADAMSADDIAEAAHTSRRTLFRAFVDVLGEPPNSYVRKLRLHRIRHDLASEHERAATVAIAANCWGISELGRLAGWYRDHFGELPSETLARATYRSSTHILTRSA